jgi:ubiquinone biosynthesis monooxygenase Coq7
MIGIDKAQQLKSMIRVNQAGEFGAKRIYAGQLAIMGDRHPAARSISHMAEQEQRHLDAFDRIMAERGVRPTVFHPFWNVAGYALGAATAVLGPEAAMACTVAVETEIDLHYSEQLEELGDSEPELPLKKAQSVRLLIQ